MVVRVKMLQNRGFECNKVIVDHKRGLVALGNRIPGVEVDAICAGDHVHLVDIQIRRLKEMRRGVLNGIPYTLLKN